MTRRRPSGLTPDALRQVDASESREAILDAARRLFSTAGYAATSVADIVREAGTSVGLPYYHFGSKESIFLTIWLDYQHQQQVRTRAAIDAGRAQGLAGVDLLVAGMRAYLEGAWAEHEIQPVLHGRSRPADFGKTVQEGADRWNRQMLALLSQYDARLSRVALVMLTEALSDVCLDLMLCKHDKEATELIDRALHLTRCLLQSLPEHNGARP